jgi:hypothetical protein
MKITPVPSVIGDRGRDVLDAVRTVGAGFLAAHVRRNAVGVEGDERHVVVVRDARIGEIRIGPHEVERFLHLFPAVERNERGGLKRDVARQADRDRLHVFQGLSAYGAGDQNVADGARAEERDGRTNKEFGADRTERR